MNAIRPEGAGSHRGSLQPADMETVNFSKGNGLVPAIVQHAGTGAALMLGYMNREALRQTLATGRVVFFSRSRGRLWEKGETSGSVLRLASVYADCDRDALLVLAWPRGPVCHLGSGTCFHADGREPEFAGYLAELETTIAQRLADPPPGSYTAALLAQGIRRIAQKVGEEGVEVALAGAAGSNAEVAAEVADLLFHTLVLLRSRSVSLSDVLQELRRREPAKAAGGPR